MKKLWSGKIIITRSGLPARMETLMTNITISELIFSDTTPPWFTNLRRYQREVGIAYYNLDISNESSTSMKKFILRYLFIELPGRTNPEGIADLESAMRSLRDYHSKYRDILNKIVHNELPSEDEIRHMNYIFNDNIIIPTRVYVLPDIMTDIQGIDRLAVGVDISTAGQVCVSGLLRAAYCFLFLPSTRNTQLKKCAIEECTNYFIPHASGHPQRFCSEVCKVKNYTRRKNTITSQT